MRKLLVAAIVVAMCAGRVFALEPADVYRQKSPAVVLIFAKVDSNSRKGGSGFFIAGNGQVLTNAHVITGNDGQALQEIQVFIKPPKVTGDFKEDLQDRHPAKVVKFDRALDVALLQVEDLASSPMQVSFANSDNVEVGQKVVAIGHPEQGGLWTLTSGTISSRIKNISRIEGKDMFQSDASINHGNSGGPLFDTDGLVVGMNTSTARMSSDGTAIVGINFALQSNVIMKWLNQNEVKVAAAVPPKSAQAEAARTETPKAAPKEALEKPSAPGAAAEGKILTPKNPYEKEALEKTIAEMEDVILEMRGKVKKRMGN
ncbi:MAG: trypsin-like peptidase domain-containing protein [Nitrospinae bacterium]|nr:trypsin-like peptidase domain-containing protein [Nitrospinota bacterium]